MLGSWVAFQLFVNNLPVARLRRGQTATVYLTPGEYAVGVGASNEVHKISRVVVERGAPRAYRVTPRQEIVAVGP